MIKKILIALLLVSISVNCVFFAKSQFNYVYELDSLERYEVKFPENDLIVRIENFGKRIKVNVDSQEAVLLEGIYSQGKDSHDTLVVSEKLTSGRRALRFISPAGQIVGEEMIENSGSQQ